MENIFLDSLFPVYGTKANNLPVWNEGQKMFISSEYESAAGNRYYKGIRFSNNLVIVETVGLYHTWTYIDSIELYIYDGEKLKLISKETYDKMYYNEQEIKDRVKSMVRGYVKGSMKIAVNCNGLITMSDADIESKAAELVEECYVSFLSDNFRLNTSQILPLIGTQD